MKYTREQLALIRNLLLRDEVKTNKIEEWLSFMFEEQHKPFLNFYDLTSIVDIIDPNLWDILSYVWYECRMMEWGGSITVDWITTTITWDAEWLIKYCEVDGILDS
jgi:hypothetical protein